MDKYYSVTEVCEIFGLHRNTILKRLRNGDIEGVKLCRDWRIPSSEVERMKGGKCDNRNKG